MEKGASGLGPVERRRAIISAVEKGDLDPANPWAAMYLLDGMWMKTYTPEQVAAARTSYQEKHPEQGKRTALSLVKEGKINPDNPMVDFVIEHEVKLGLNTQEEVDAARKSYAELVEFGKHIGCTSGKDEFFSEIGYNCI